MGSLFSIYISVKLEDQEVTMIHFFDGGKFPELAGHYITAQGLNESTIIQFIGKGQTTQNYAAIYFDDEGYAHGNSMDGAKLNAIYLPTNAYVKIYKYEDDTFVRGLQYLAEGGGGSSSSSSTLSHGIKNASGSTVFDGSNDYTLKYSDIQGTPTMSNLGSVGVTSLTASGAISANGGITVPSGVTLSAQEATIDTLTCANYGTTNLTVGSLLNVHNNNRTALITADGVTCNNITSNGTATLNTTVFVGSSGSTNPTQVYANKTNSSITNSTVNLNSSNFNADSNSKLTINGVTDFKGEVDVVTTGVVLTNNTIIASTSSSNPDELPTIAKAGQLLWIRNSSASIVYYRCFPSTANNKTYSELQPYRSRLLVAVYGIVLSDTPNSTFTGFYWSPLV